MDMKPKDEIKILNTTDFKMLLESTTYDHVGGYGQLIEITKPPKCMMDLNHLIEQLENARRLINPDWSEDKEYYNERKYRVLFWEHLPALILIEGEKDQKVYTVAPVIDDKVMERYKINMKKPMYHAKCNACSKLMNEGYVINNGDKYFCSAKCLDEMTLQDFDDLYMDGNGDSYWTSWESEDEFFYYEDGTEV